MLRQLVKLTGGAVPYAEAVQMSPVRRLAWLVAADEMRGGEFDWATQMWVEKTP